MITATSAIEKEIDEFLSTTFSSEFSSYIIFIISAVVSCIIFPLFVIRLFKTVENGNVENGQPIRAYIYKSTADLGKHRIVLVSVPAISIFELIKSIYLSDSFIYGKWIIIFGAAFIVIGILTVIPLAKFRSLGIVMLFAFVFYYAAYEQLLLILKSNAITSYYESCDTVSRYGSYVAVDYLIAQCMILCFVIILILRFLTAYYYPLRFLFMPGKLGMPICPKCGKPIVKGDKFCICCGEKVENKCFGLDVDPLDKERHCRKCGALHNSCTCGNENPLIRLAKEKTKEKNKATARSIFIAIVMVAVVIVPNLCNSVTNLQKGINEINNSFVVRWDEFCENHEKALDNIWLADFNSKVNALHTFNSQWQYYDIGKLKYSELPYYQAYSNASFQQMKVLEEMHSLVNNTSYGKNDVSVDDQCRLLSMNFTQTINEQSNALTLYKPNFSPNIFEYIDLAKNIFYGGVRFYVSNWDVTIIAIVLYSMSFLMLIFILNSFSITEKTEILGIYLIVKNKMHLILDKTIKPKYLQPPYSAMKKICLIKKDIWTCILCNIYNIVGLCIAVFFSLLIFLSLFSVSSITPKPH